MLREQALIVNCLSRQCDGLWLLKDQDPCHRMEITHWAIDPLLVTRCAAVGHPARDAERQNR